MDAATLARCTEAFFATKAKEQGTGPGLFLVRSAVERYGGTLDVESKVGEGSSFLLVLPADEPGLTVTPTLTSRATHAQPR
jgi:signal transduction histidine kinase